jgi:acyl-CoA synthetase (AMP-forming)/AMP-acid ligase II
LRVIGDLSRVNARRYPQKIALAHGERTLTYQALDSQSNRLAHALAALGVSAGERVALLAYNCLEFAIITQGVAKAGAILVPMNFRLAADELKIVLRDAQPRVIVSAPAFVASLRPVLAEMGAAAPQLVLIDGGAADARAADAASSMAALMARESEAAPLLEVDPAGPCVIMYTSGTTGNPKGVLVSHEAYFRMYAATSIDTGLSHDDVFLMAVPMFHAAGMNMMLHQALFLGASGVIHSGPFDAEAIFGLIDAHRISMAVLIPTIIGIMARHPRRAVYDLSSLRRAFYGSMPMPPAILQAALEAFPATAFNQLYGSTESGMLLVLPWTDHASHPNATGREALLSEVRVVDAAGRDVQIGEIGEVLGARSSGMLGYWRNPAATAETIVDGWIHTGDLARRESDGFYTVVGRIKEMIISGGENIYPVEVERVLSLHPAVREVAVFGMPDELYGENVCAAVVLNAPTAGAEGLDAEDLDAYCKSRLAAYKRPRRYEFLAALPRNASDKVQKNELRREFAARAAPRSAG